MVSKLRIAWSVYFAVLCVLLIALWVRSYVVYDRVVIHYPSGLDWFIAYSNKGKCIVSTYALLAPELSEGWWFVGRTRWGTAVCVPFSFAIAAACLILSAAWIPWRFSLRTLLIAMTLVAVVLGLIVGFAGH